MIFHMELLPGTKISELQISAMLKISRTPIHDALRRLAADGLVTIETNRIAVVTQYTDAEIQEIGTIRLSLDILAAELAAYYGSAADFDSLCQLAKICESAAASGDIYGRIQADTEFHLEIARISGNDHLCRELYAIYLQVHLIQISKYTDIESSLIQIHHHLPLIDAIRTGNLIEIRRLTCEHMKDFYHIDPYVLKCYGGEAN
ncbi:MAG: GntR family transcriptional regulator [Clostridiales bacterium]|nr:GntR family transcriptional regulator [Clostridiales bacterium]